jgi:phage replication O-like protein O
MKDLEDGFTRIANEVLDDLAKCKDINIRGRVLIAIIRLTWGWKGHPKERELAISYIAEHTGITIRQAARALTQLVKGGEIIRSKSITGYNKYWPVAYDKSVIPMTNLSLTNEVVTYDKSGTKPMTTLSYKERKKEKKRKIKDQFAAEEIFLSDKMKAEAAKQNLSIDDLENEFENFKGYYGDDRHSPYKWLFMWRRWCENYHKRKEQHNPDRLDKIADEVFRKEHEKEKL